MATVDSTLAPKSVVEEIVRAVPVPRKLLDGVVVYKVNTIGKMQKRVLTLSEDKFTLTVTHTFKTEKNLSMTLRPILKRVTSFGTTDDGDMESGDKKIDIGSIKRIQRGQSTLRFELARYRKDRSPKMCRKVGENSVLDPERSFSIIFTGERTLDLMTQTEDDHDELLNALDRLVESYQTVKVKASKDVLLLRYVWLDVDKDHSNTINEDELGNLLRRINFYVTKKDLKERYWQFARVIGLDKDSRRRGLTFEQCVTFLHKVKRDTWQVKPVKSIWKELFGEYKATGEFRTTVSAGTFLQRFLHKKQGQYEANIDFVRKLFKKMNSLEVANVASSASVGSTECIDLNHFEAYLLSSENDAFDPKREMFRAEDMNRPISHYWINSSHNTYLKGDQLQSTSSVEMYVNALYRGCRCVELDTHDGDANEPLPVPIVYHGHTMTSKINFSDIIKCIRVFLNFHPDSYPIILSLENHCSLRYQQVMAQQLIKILGDKLYIPDDTKLEKSELPTVESLKGMVLIKGRRVIGDENDGGGDDDSTYWGSDDAYLVESSDDGQPSTPNDGNADSEAQGTSFRYHKVHPELSRITLFHGTSFKTWEESTSNPTNHMHSFSESKVNKILSQNQCQEWIRYNQTHMSRVYPGGIRLDSSNFYPYPAWSTGCQLVALNFQTSDTALRANDGRFRENGNCGYVLKPEELLHQDFNLDDQFEFPFMRLTIRILSGSCLPKQKGKPKGECIDPYVQVTLFDLDNRDVSMKTYYTRSVSNNGFFPIWNSEEFRFTVKNQSVAILQFNVWDRDITNRSDFIASSSIPISCLRKGYRSVQLFDSSNTKSGAFDFASLLTEIVIEQSLQEV